MNFNIVKIAKAGHNICMEPIRLPSIEDIGAAYDEGKEAVIKLFHETVRQLAERFQKIEDQIAKTAAKARSYPP